MKKIFIIIVLIIGGYFALGFVKKDSEKTNELPSYVGYRVRVADLDNYVSADGIVEAKNTRKIFVDKNLKVKNLYFEEGDYINEGDLIMTFDDEEKNRLLRSIEKEELDLMELNRDLANAEELFKLGGSTKNEIENLKWNIRKKQLTLDEYEEELSKTISEILSPFAGTIISMVAEENYRVNTEVELFEIANLSEVIIKAKVPEYDIINVKVGQTVRIKPEVFNKSEVLEGTIVKIANLSTEVSGSSEAYVEVDIEVDGIGQKLLPGFTADVEIVYQNKEDTIFVPRASLFNDQLGMYVYEVTNNTTKKTYVETGIANTDTIEITSGLSGDEMIIANGNKNIPEGITINLTRGELARGGQKREGEAPPMGLGGGRGSR